MYDPLSRIVLFGCDRNVRRSFAGGTRDAHPQHPVIYTDRAAPAQLEVESDWWNRLSAARACLHTILPGSALVGIPGDRWTVDSHRIAVPAQLEDEP